MRNTTPFVLVALVAATACSGAAGQAAAQAARPWDFQMKKVWELQKVGDDSLLRPGEPRVADDGTLYFRDFERKRSYIVDADGKPVGTFAPPGSNEGEVPFYLNCFPAGDDVVICAPDKLHFFTKQGRFVKAVPNNLFVRFPLAFKNENEFWVAPGTLGDAGKDTVSVVLVNLASEKETTVHNFVLSADEKKPSGGAVVLGLTPQAMLTYAPKLNLICFGKNSDSVIYWLPAGGGEGGSFTFAGTRRPVSEAEKRAHFAGRDVPENVMGKMINALPDRMAYYHRMQIVDGLVYLFSAEGLGGNPTGQVVDVLSPDGQRLYHGRIQVEDGWHISSPDCLQLAQGFVYAVQENDAGAKKIVKYSVALPKP